MQSDFKFQSVSFTSPRLDLPVELNNVVTDLEIFEDLNFPYLTGRLTVVDDSGFLTDVDIVGGETIFIKIISTRKNAKSFTKTFYISGILSTTKVSDTAESHTFNLIEDIGYVSNLQNVNKSYNDQCGTIITKIAKNYLQKTVSSLSTDSQSIKVIIPNLNPIEAMMWIRDRATTVNGYPFYLFSTLTSDSIKYVDLGTMLSSPVINENIPYRYTSAPFQSENEEVQRRILTAYEQKDINNLYRYIQRGLIGAKYEYIDTVKNQRNTFQYNVAKDLFQPLITKSVLPKNQNNVMYGSRYNLNGKPFNELESRTITRIGGSSAFENAKSYKESILASEYKNNVTGQAMKELLANAPITFGVFGIDFIDGDKHSTIGNNLRIHFTYPNPDPKIDDPLIDRKKSGDYLIFATHHLFRKMGESFRHDIKMTGSKLANYSSVK